MEILVCVKRVPDIWENEIEVNSSGTDIDRSDLVYSVNEWDNYAVEEAIQIRDNVGGTVTIVTIGGEDKGWPVKDLDAIAASSCSYCTDLTGMNSDLSCGNIGSDDGWTTVLVRSKRGDKALKAVIKEGLVEAEKIDEKALQAVINTARSKKNKRFKLKPPH